jgi:hypothetical protein
MEPRLTRTETRCTAQKGTTMTTTAKTRKTTTSAAAEKAKIKDKVRKLLAQAEDTSVTDEEAQAFAAKAAELLARYGLDAATVRADKGQKPEAVTRYDFTVSGQGWHGKARASLIYRVAQAYGCEVCTIGNRMDGKDRSVVMIGTASMIDALKMLLPSILVQAETNGMRARKAHIAEIGDRFAKAADKNIESRTFYRSYLEGYGHGVAEKLAATRQIIADEVKGKPGELVLVTDADRIKADFAKRFPKLGTTAADKVSIDGLIAGKRDGRTADTGQTKVNTGSRKAIKN